VKSPIAERNFAVDDDVGIGQVDRENRLAFVNRRAQQQRSLPPEEHVELREIARALVVHPELAIADLVEIAVLIEDGEGFALFQYADRRFVSRRRDENRIRLGGSRSLFQGPLT
jgi:PAS domain-containing protein